MEKQNTIKKETEASAPVYNPEEGTFYEKVMFPNKITVLEEGEDEASQRVAILEDKNGEKMTVRGNRVVHRLFQVFVNQLLKDKMTSHLWKKSNKEISTTLTKVMKAQIKKFLEKPPTVKFLVDANGKVHGATSTLHKQISWSEVRKIVESAITKAYGKTATLEFGDTRWDYKIPVESENVSAWAEVERGTNLGMGRAGIRVHGRFRTESTDFGMTSPCHNWAGLWSPVLSLFDIKDEKILRIPNHDVINTRHVHMRGTFSNEESIEELAQNLLTLKAGVIELNKAIENSKHIPLSYKEMEAILDAYDEKVHLPKYSKLDILDRAKWQDSETVYAFSQAISWIRTHGELRQKKTESDREFLTLTKKLENMAGEIYFLSPTIQSFHEQIGEITFDKLILKPKRVKKAITVATTGAEMVAPEVDPLDNLESTEIGEDEFLGEHEPTQKNEDIDLIPEESGVEDLEFPEPDEDDGFTETV